MLNQNFSTVSKNIKQIQKMVDVCLWVVLVVVLFLGGPNIYTLFYGKCEYVCVTLKLLSLCRMAQVR